MTGIRTFYLLLVFALLQGCSSMSGILYPPESRDQAQADAYASYVLAASKATIELSCVGNCNIDKFVYRAPFSAPQFQASKNIISEVLESSTGIVPYLTTGYIAAKGILGAGNTSATIEGDGSINQSKARTYTDASDAGRVGSYEDSRNNYENATAQAQVVQQQVVAPEIVHSSTSTSTATSYTSVTTDTSSEIVSTQTAGP